MENQRRSQREVELTRVDRFSGRKTEVLIRQQAHVGVLPDLGCPLSQPVKGITGCWLVDSEELA